MNALSSRQLTRLTLAAASLYLLPFPRLSAEPLPAALSTVAAGDGDSLVVKADGSAWAFGLNASGQAGDGTTMEHSIPRQVMNSVRSVAAGNDFNLFLHRDGTAWASGGNGSGQLGDGTYQARSTPALLLTDVQAVSARGTTSLLLKNDGTAWASGGSLPGWTTFQAHQVMDSVQAIAAGDGFALFLKNDGTVMGLGDSYYGQLGLPFKGYANQPVIVMSGVKAIAAGSRHALFLKTDGSLWLLGQGNDSVGEDTPPIPLQIASGATAIAAGLDGSYFLKEDGSAWAANPAAPASPTLLLATGVAALAAGRDHLLFAMTDGSFRASGKHANGRLGNGATDLVVKPAPITDLPPVRLIAAAGDTSFFIDQANKLFACGPMALQTLDNSSTLGRDGPIPRLNGVSAVAPSPGFAQYLDLQGNVTATGYNANGAVGYPASLRTPSQPVAVLSSVRQVATSLDVSYFLRTDGTLWATGLHHGQPSPLASGVLVPSQVKLVDGVKQIAAGDRHLLILKNDGSIWSAGDNSHGQTGHFTNDIPAPLAQINSHGLDIVALSAGSTHSLFLTATGEVWGMGSNLHGELTGDQNTDVTTPQRIAQSMKSILAGPGNSFFIRTAASGGYLYACGRDDYGQLGDAGRSDRRSLVASLPRVLSVATGDRHTLILQENGTVWAVGDNSRGQTGLPTGESTPVAVYLPAGPQPTWEQENFGTADATDPAIAGPHADPDHDGITNLQERAFNLSPLSPFTIILDPAGDTGLPALTATPQPDGSHLLTLQYLREKASWGGDLTYAPQVSGSLGSSDWAAFTGSEIIESIDAHWERVTIQDTAGAGQPARFARVQVTSAAPSP